MMSRPNERSHFRERKHRHETADCRSLSTIAVAVSLLIVVPADAVAQIDAQRGLRPVMRRPIPAAALRGSVDFLRTELFFGTAKPDGVVTDEEFFASSIVITPRFPDGLTLLKGDGQFRDEEGEIVKEESFVLILLYPLEDFRDSSRKSTSFASATKTSSSRSRCSAWTIRLPSGSRSRIEA